ncbi:hypothetical protein [Halobellus ordinarius]|uniref:hypothetical protein n=1 Tax=Halobellus ordinarius TaxID=3075120 RepID=UPI0028806223|nr:hypothetical protein [Halobellus sp. ZY16]
MNSTHRRGLEPSDATAESHRPNTRLRTDGGETSADSTDDFRHDTWFDAFKASTRQFAAETEDLEAILAGDAGFHTFFHTEGVDVTRGVQTAIYQGLYDTLEELYVDEELVEQRHGECTPEAVADEVIEQITHEHGVSLSDHVEETIRDRVTGRVRDNIDNRGGEA